MDGSGSSWIVINPDSDIIKYLMARILIRPRKYIVLTDLNRLLNPDLNPSFSLISDPDFNKILVRSGILTKVY
jgi:hypothetical protein